MKVILKKDVQSLGEAGDVVEVKDGYARNFLIPSDMAEESTKGALKNRDANIARIKAKAEKLHQEALATAEKIEKVEIIEIKARAGETGKLFGAITTKKLAEVLKEKSGIEIDRRNISLDNPINKVGDFKMKVKISSKVEVSLPIKVVASEVIEEQSIIDKEETATEAE